MIAFKRFYFAIESFIVTRFLGNGPGPLLRFVFKLPIWQYKLGMQRPISGQILILNTIGRRSGKRRQTALGYGYDADSKTYSVMTGWGGRSDWYQNALVNPDVELWIGQQRLKAIAEPVPSDQAIEKMKALIAINPHASDMLGKLSKKPFDGSEIWYQEMVRLFPYLSLTPIDY
jgi:deazaflavin-dependent oxidoreductase (nitroreductase family)